MNETISATADPFPPSPMTSDSLPIETSAAVPETFRAEHITDGMIRMAIAEAGIPYTRRSARYVRARLERLAVRDERVTAAEAKRKRKALKLAKVASAS